MLKMFGRNNYFSLSVETNCSNNEKLKTTHYIKVIQRITKAIATKIDPNWTQGL